MRRFFGHIDLAVAFAQSGRILSGGGDTLQIGQPLDLFRCAIGYEFGGKNLVVKGMVYSPGQLK